MSTGILSRNPGRVRRAVDWQRLRNELNHDWLKNTYLVALGNWLNVLSGEVENERFERTFMDSTFREWEVGSGRIRALLATFPGAMSPRSLLSASPLRGVSRDTKDWLGPLIHALWVNREGVQQTIEGATSALETADRTYREILSSRPGDLDAASTDWGASDAKFDEFARRCSALGDELSKLPREVKVA